MQFDLSCPSCQTKFEIEKKDGKSDARSDWATRICFSDDVQWKSVKNWFKFRICSERLDLYMKCHETQCQCPFHVSILWDFGIDLFYEKNLCFLKILPVFFVQGEQFIQGHLHMVALTAPSFRVHQARCVRWKSPCLPCVYHNMLMILWVYYI